MNAKRIGLARNAANARYSLVSCLLGAALACGLAGCQGEPSTGTALAPAASPTPAPLVHAIAGKILLEGQERHSGVWVFLGATPHFCYTNTRGEYRLEGVAPGRYELLAEKDGYFAPEPIDIDLPADAPSREFLQASIVLQPRPAAVAEAPAAAAAERQERPATLAGAALLEGRESHEGITARIVETGAAAMTDARGEYYFAEIEPGAYQLELSKSGFAAVAMPVIVKRAVDNRAEDATLSPVRAEGGAGAISGRALMFLANGEPSADFDRVSVRLEGQGRGATLEPDGSFRFENLPLRDYTVVAEARGYRLLQTERVDLRLAATAEVTLRFDAVEETKEAALGAVRGKVRHEDADGPQSGIAVALGGTQWIGLTDSTGAFVFQEVPEGMYTFFAEDEGYERLEVDGIGVVAGQTLDLGLLTLRKKPTPPRVLETAPADGERNIPVLERLPVVIRFSEPMRPASVESAITISPPVIFGVNAGRLHPESNTATVYLELLGDTPSDYVRFDTTYQVRIDTIAEDMEGERMERPYTFSFRTGKPQVIGSRPADGERFALLSPQDPLVFMLNDQLDQRSLSERDIVIQPRLETNPRIEAYSDPQSGWTSIYVSGVWKPDTEYRVTLGKAIANVDGVSFGNTPFEVRFRTSPQRPLAPSTLDGQQRIRSGR